MSTHLDLSGLGRIRERLRRVANPDATKLMVSWEKIIDDDNRRGILDGLNKDGVPMPPVTYRPRPTGPLKATRVQKNNPKKGARRGHFAGFGPAVSGLHNNLTSAEYRRLGGPPLAPRGAFSRVITNLKFRSGRVSAMVWQAIGYWDQVVSTKGVPFLQAHFDGARAGKRRRVKLPRRDLRGVRPGGLEKARRALRAWALDLIRRSG